MNNERIAKEILKLAKELVGGESREAKVSLGSLKRSQGTLADVAQRMFDKYELTVKELDRGMSLTLDTRNFESAFEKVMKSWNVEIRD